MKKIAEISLILIIAVLFQSCSTTKVLTAWKGEQDTVDKFKKKNILVIARTSNNQARITFEEAIASQLRAKGIAATESFIRMPLIHPEKEMTEERVKFLKTILESEGYTGIVLTVIKEKEQYTQTSTSGVYPGYYGGFYDYYRTPYAYGSYYSSFGSYNPLSATTRAVADYVLETVAYNLDEPGKNQLVAVVTTSVKDPRFADKTVQIYVDEIMNHLEEK